MKNLNRYMVALMFVTLIYIPACATTTAPQAWLPELSVAQRDGFGGWVSIKYGTEKSETTIHGELIAIDLNQLSVLTAQGMIFVPSKNIDFMKLTTYDSKSGRFAGWTCLGTLSTISHGVFLIFTAPAWLLGGSCVTGIQSREPQITYPEKSLDEFRAFARFPQGLPKGIDGQSLSPKRPGEKISVSTETPESPQNHRNHHKF